MLLQFTSLRLKLLVSRDSGRLSRDFPETPDTFQRLYRDSGKTLQRLSRDSPETLGDFPETLQRLILGVHHPMCFGIFWNPKETPSNVNRNPT